MKVINVFECYYEANGTFNGVLRRGANVQLVATSDAGEVVYEVAVSFFPHEDDEDFRISYDACFQKELYRARGRRSKKREEEYLKTLFDIAGSLAAEQGAKIYFDRPLIEPRRG